MTGVLDETLIKDEFLHGLQAHRMTGYLLRQFDHLPPSWPHLLPLRIETSW